MTQKSKYDHGSTECCTSWAPSELKILVNHLTQHLFWPTFFLTQNLCWPWTVKTTPIKLFFTQNFFNLSMFLDPQFFGNQHFSDIQLFWTTIWTKIYCCTLIFGLFYNSGDPYRGEILFFMFFEGVTLLFLFFKNGNFSFFFKEHLFGLRLRYVGS